MKTCTTCRVTIFESALALAARRCIGCIDRDIAEIAPKPPASLPLGSAIRRLACAIACSEEPIPEIASDLISSCVIGGTDHELTRLRDFARELKTESDR